MAEGTTRVDETGGEPIASELEWTAARLEPRRGGERSSAGVAAYRAAGAREEHSHGVFRTEGERREALDERTREREADRWRGRGEDLGPTSRKEALRRDIEANRREVVRIVEELDQRRRDLMDARLQFRRHRTTILAGALGFALLAGTSAFLIVRRQQLRGRPSAKARRLRYAVGRMIERPEYVARPSPSVRDKAMAAAASGASGIFAKKVAERLASMI